MTETEWMNWRSSYSAPCEPMKAHRLTFNHRRSQGVHWMHVHPRVEKKLGKFTGWNCKCTSRLYVHPPRQRNSTIFEEIGEIWRAGVVTLVLLACVLMVTTEKGCQLFRARIVQCKVCTLSENPGYAYAFSPITGFVLLETTDSIWILKND